MKLPKQVEVKHTARLFNNKYQYKIVLRSGIASWFRGSDLTRVEKFLVDYTQFTYRPPTATDLTFGQQLYNTLSNMEDWTCRVETPFLSVYTNSESDAETLIKLDVEAVKYVSIPDPSRNTNIPAGTVIVKNLDFGFKVSMGSTNQNLGAFVKWCENNPKIRLPKRAARDLNKNVSSGGSHFYVKDDKSLTMVKMFLGRFITRVEAVIKG